MFKKIKLVSVAEMIAIEREADASGLTYADMMENAGAGLAAVIQDRYGYLDEVGVLGLVGSGNNGGDTLISLEKLALDGWKTAAYLVRPRQAGDELIKRVLEVGCLVYKADEDSEEHQNLLSLLAEYGILLDGVLGTGIRLPLKPEVGLVLDRVRGILASIPKPPLVVAVDCPSGIDCDTGETAPETIAADLTVTMAAIKKGLLSFPAYGLIGELALVGIGLDENLPAYQKINRSIVTAEDVRSCLPDRPFDAHKGTFGTALIIAGSSNYTGAVYLSGRAAYLAGAGLVTLAVPSLLHQILAGTIPEATWLLLPHEMGMISRQAASIVQKNLDRATALLIGPGFGVEDTTLGFLESLFAGNGEHKDKRGIGFVQNGGGDNQRVERIQLPSLVLDADGLKLLAKIPDWPRRLPDETVLTPHPGEMAVLTGLSKDEIQKDRVAVAEKYAAQWGHVVVLKGAHTVIAEPDGQTGLIPVATPALARAGTGDVLAGLITGLLAQGLPAYEAAMAGAWIHAQAGLAAEASLGSSAVVVAGDVLEAIIDVMCDLVS
jgi:ADP-dependent NAD(P)H-hydrate dehydratase / NAD(P)H-hydrate epimerase